jgi:hypothetical protein
MISRIQLKAECLRARVLLHEIQKASQHFDKVEIWRKNQVEKDPIGVGCSARSVFSSPAGVADSFRGDQKIHAAHIGVEIC